MSTYYGPAAYEGFAKAFAARVGVKVQVTSGTNACVDANGTINLPGMSNYQTLAEFQDTCATIIHEVAHVVYGSHAEFAAHHNRERLFKDCLNAVMDVADENGIGDSEIAKNNPRPNTLLVNSNVHAWNNNSRTYTDLNHPAPHWQILVAGIIAKRIGRGWSAGNTRWYKHHFGQRGVDVQKVFTTIGQARLKSRRAGNHGQLIRLAEKLTVLLSPIAPPPDDPAQPTAGEIARGKGQANMIPNGGIKATEAEGALIEGGLAGLSPGSGAGNQPSASPRGTRADRSAQAMLEPVVKRIAARLATDGDSINRDSGYLAGTGVSQPWRIMTDGGCMGRWSMDPHADGANIAVLLDTSSSMNNRGEVCGVAQAFVQGMMDFATLKTWTFGGDGSQECDGFNRANFAGGTPTAQALMDARDWLKTTEGRKIIVCITDGQPCDRPATIDQCERARSEAVKVIAVGLGYDGLAESLHATMPGATIVSAEDVNRLAIQLGQVALTV